MAEAGYALAARPPFRFEAETFQQILAPVPEALQMRFMRFIDARNLIQYQL